jgi:hypothetical protein
MSPGTKDKEERWEKRFTFGHDVDLGRGKVRAEWDGVFLRVIVPRIDGVIDDMP